jgi:hypothetical protein
MHVTDALEQLDDIHEHITRAEVYRGFQAPCVAAVGIVGLAAAMAQPLVAGTGEPRGFVLYWIAVAAVCALLGSSGALYAYFFHEDDFAQRRTRRVVAQFIPCLVAGGFVTAGFTIAGGLVIPFLPGVWAALFGLGMIAVRPHLPRTIGLVGWFYVAAGGWLILRAASVPELSGLAVGGVFGAGHLAAALVLFRREEARVDE